jgi:Acyl-CoA dehydrogenase N terminal
VHTARDAGCTGTLVARADSAFYSAAFTGAVCKAGAYSSVTVQMNSQPGRTVHHLALPRTGRGEGCGSPAFAGLTWVMAEYVPPLRDIRFVLEQVVDLSGLSKLEAYHHADPDTVFGG